MRNLKLYAVIWTAIGVCTAGVCTVAAAGEFRKWTAAQGGYTTEAEFVALKPGDIVSIKLKSGTAREIPLDKLSEADREYVRKVSGAAGTAATATPASAATASSAPTGKGMGDEGISNAEPKATGPALDDDAANKALKAVGNEANRCQTAEEAVLLYNMFLGDRVLPTAIREKAEKERAEWKARADQKLVRLGTRWVTLDEVRNAKKQAHFLLNQGLEMVRLTQDQLGLEKLLEASKTDPDGIHPDFTIATVYAIVAKRFDKANQHYEVCLKRDPDNVAVLNNLALCEVKIGQHREAILHWKTAAALRYDERIAQNLGRLFDQAGKRRIPMTKSALDQLSDVYAGLVIGKNVMAANKMGGWHYMLLPAEPPPDESVAPSDETVASGQEAVSGCGSGFIIAQNLVVTNRHMTKGASGFYITNSQLKGQRLPAKLIASSTDYDLALLQCQGLNGKPMPLTLDIPRVGLPVTIAGFADSDTLGANLKTAQGVVVSPPSRALAGMFQYNAIASSGGAGGPVVDGQGNVIAIHSKSFSSMVSRYGAGMPTYQAFLFIRESIPGYHLNPNKADLAPTDLANQLAESSVVVLCSSPAADVGLAKRVAGEYLEDASCCMCNGLKNVKCPFRSCTRGTVPKTEQVVVGRTPQGAAMYGSNTIRVQCPNCHGDGVVRCPACNGTGRDPDVRLGAR